MMTKVSHEILKILVYSDLFKYPLTLDEIHQRSSYTRNDIETGLSELIAEQKLFFFDGFYNLQNTTENIESRKKRNMLSKKYIPIALFITKIVSFFPFIRGIYLSGSISKNCMDKNSDIDFFIIAAPNRLWIARLFCILFKKLFLFDSPKYFCFNYILDTDHLEIKEKNIFTAIEILTLIPVFGHETYRQFLVENSWVKDYYPNLRPNYDAHKIIKKPVFQKAIEFLFENRFGDWLDNFLFQKTIEVNKNRHPAKFFENPQHYLNFQKYVAKAHTYGHQPKILNNYNLRLKEYFQNEQALLS